MTAWFIRSLIEVAVRLCDDIVAASLGYDAVIGAFGGMAVTTQV